MLSLDTADITTSLCLSITLSNYCLVAWSITRYDKDIQAQDIKHFKHQRKRGLIDTPTKTTQPPNIVASSQGYDMPIQTSARDHATSSSHLPTLVRTHIRRRGPNNGREKRTTALRLFVIEVGGTSLDHAYQQTSHDGQRCTGISQSQEHEGVPRSHRCRCDRTARRRSS